MNLRANPSADGLLPPSKYTPPSPGSTQETAKYYYNKQIRNPRYSRQRYRRGGTYSGSTLHESIDTLEHREAEVRTQGRSNCAVNKHTHERAPEGKRAYKNAQEDKLAGSKRKMDYEVKEEVVMRKECKQSMQGIGSSGKSVKPKLARGGRRTQAQIGVVEYLLQGVPNHLRYPGVGGTPESASTFTQHITLPPSTEFRQQSTLQASPTVTTIYQGASAFDAKGMAQSVRKYNGGKKVKVEKWSGILEQNVMGIIVFGNFYKNGKWEKNLGPENIFLDQID
ncbi:hypothetical protein HOY80DRAFT_1065760 [Tuber brumale]|nr:hypothetical protein HOY80DRAFT_1065760 [Tuber brumale]